MRGEPNTIGVPTKWCPGVRERDYFKDSDLNYLGVLLALEESFQKIEHILEAGFYVVFPQDGLGTGRAQLATRAPKILKLIQDKISKLEEKFK